MNNTFKPIEVSLEQRKLLDGHLHLAMELNKTVNLTRITSWEKGQLLHVEDSLLGLEAITKAPRGKYGDIGTGGGFPGIPLAIMTGRETVLVDSIGKKTKALDFIIKELGLSNQISTFNGRTEDLALEQPNSFSVITARALFFVTFSFRVEFPVIKTRRTTSLL